jgi:O-antigen ligase
MTGYFLLFLFAATMGSRALGLDLGLAPGISIKNAMLYVAFSAIAIESAMARNRNVELLPVILPYALLILYAILTWLFIVLFMEDPYYSPRTTLIRLKIKLVDQFLILLVFFYGVINWKDALWLLKALIWVMIIGCLITILDTFNIPDLGIITARDRDGRIEGIIGSAAEFGGLLAFVLPAIVALWWTETGTKKTFALFGIGLALVSLMLSGSRGAMVGLVGGAIVAAIYLRQYVSAQILVRATMAAVIFTAIAVLVVLATDFEYLLKERLSTGLETGDVKYISSGRTAIWSAALDDMADNPLSFVTGLGWESYYQTAAHRYATHSMYLDRLYNLGIVGLTLFALCYLNALAIARSGLRTATVQAAPFLMATIIGMASFMIAMAFTDMEAAALYIWAYAGLALRIAVSNPSPQRDERGRMRDHTYETTRPTSLTPK